MRRSALHAAQAIPLSSAAPWADRGECTGDLYVCTLPAAAAFCHQPGLGAHAAFDMTDDDE